MAIANRRAVLVTNVKQYAGEGSTTSLLAQGCLVLAHDPSFASDAVRNAYEAEHPNVIALSADGPEDLVQEMLSRNGLVDAVVSNNVHPICNGRIEDLSVTEYREAFEALTIYPIRLTQLLLPGMKERKQGSFVFITSARPERPEPGFSVPTTIRAATTTFARALAQEVAADGIQVNVVAPNFLHSKLYYPKARFIDDENGRRNRGNRSCRSTGHAGGSGGARRLPGIWCVPVHDRSSGQFHWGWST